MTDRRSAQQRADRIRAFRDELGALSREGANPLSAEQERTLRQHHDAVLAALSATYDIDSTDEAGQLSRGLRLASFFGALTLSAAIYSLVSRFWADLGLPAQVGLLTLFPLLALAGVDLAARRERTLYVASLFALVAYATFWLAAIVVAELLDIPVTPPLLWLGVIFGLSLGVVYQFRLVFAAALVVFIVAMAGTLFSLAGAPWTMALERLEPGMIAAFSLLVLASRMTGPIVSLAHVARLVGLVIGLGCLFVLAATAEVSQLPVSAAVAENVYRAVMLAACVGIIAWGLRTARHDVTYVAAVFLTLFLLVRYVDWFWDLLPNYLFFLLMAAAAFAWIWALRRIRARAMRSAS